MGKKTSTADLVSTANAAEILGVIPRRVQALVTAKRLVPVMQVGRAFLFRRSDVEGFVKLGPRGMERPAKKKGGKS